MKLNYGKQSINQDDIKSVVKVLKSDWLTQGPQIDLFERNLNKYLGSKYCCVVNNGTSALHLAGLSLGWKKNDVIITTPITFLATSNAIIYNNATPDFVDIDKNNLTMDLNILEEKLIKYKKLNKKVKAVIGVDFSGQPCDWINLRFLANKYSFKLINDNCHALGAEYNGTKKYASKYADIVTQSFHPVKNITTGEGGAVLTNDKDLFSRLVNLRSHGMTKDKKKLLHNTGPWYYEMHQLGYNFRITDFQCALGINQLKRLDSFINKRRNIANRYDSAFKNNIDLLTPLKIKNSKHAYHIYPLQINFEKINISKKTFFYKMKKKGINLMVHYLPIISQPFYKKKFNFKEKNFKNSINFYKKSFSLPMYPGLMKNEVDYVVKNVLENIDN